MKKQKNTLVKLSPTSAQQLREISLKRKSEDALIKTQQSILAEQIDQLHKREVKQ